MLCAVSCNNRRVCHCCDAEYITTTYSRSNARATIVFFLLLNNSCYLRTPPFSDNFMSCLHIGFSRDCESVFNLSTALRSSHRRMGNCKSSHVNLHERIVFKYVLDFLVLPRLSKWQRKGLPELPMWFVAMMVVAEIFCILGLTK
jgi:hypothetical protein